MKGIRYAAFTVYFASFGINAVDWQFVYRPADVGYATYGNSLGDLLLPSTHDKKIAFEVRGEAAREMFEAMGPDRKDTCADDVNTRFRSRDNEKLACTENAEGKYTCYFGFDLKSGKSIGGSIC